MSKITSLPRVVEIPNLAMIQEITATGESTTINLNGGRYVVLTLEASTTLTITNPRTPPTADQFVLVVIQGGDGGYSITFPTGTRWSNGIALDLSTAVGAKDVLLLDTWEGGEPWNVDMVRVSFMVPE